MITWKNYPWWAAKSWLRALRVLAKFSLSLIGATIAQMAAPNTTGLTASTEVRLVPLDTP